MRTIRDIYDTYHVPPNLQLHMYRVAAIGRYVADQCTQALAIDLDLVTRVNLLHDIANLIKYDFRPGKLLSIPENDVSSWIQTQKSFIATYGTSENKAALTIVKELGLGERVVELFSQHSISKIEYAISQSDWTIKIIRYSDERISPSGVVTVQSRYEDLIARYRGRDHHLADEQMTLKRRDMVYELEKQIQSKVNVDLQTITNADIEPYIEPLQDFEI